jgi:hypothetical protein
LRLPCSDEHVWFKLLRTRRQSQITREAGTSIPAIMLVVRAKPLSTAADHNVQPMHWMIGPSHYLPAGWKLREGEVCDVSCCKSATSVLVPHHHILRNGYCNCYKTCGRGKTKRLR